MTSYVQLRRGMDDCAPVSLHTDSSGTNDLCFSPDGRQIAAISKSGAVWLFATQNGELVWRGRVPAIGWSVTFTPDGKYLLTGDSDGVVRHWLVDPEQQRQLAESKLRNWTWDAEDERILRENGIDPGSRR
jgi:WD40 repeat protein